LGFFGSIIPLIAERSIDEEGNLLGNQWLLTRMSGYGKRIFILMEGWANFCYVLRDSGKGGCSMTELGTKFGVGLNGVLRFPVPSRKLLQ
jgi:hypothetical protein